jgi:hypothetical protein
MRVKATVCGDGAGPLMVWAPLASNVYHDFLWYPTVGYKRFENHTIRRELSYHTPEKSSTMRFDWGDVGIAKCSYLEH